MRTRLAAALLVTLVAALPTSAQSLFSREEPERQGLLVDLEAFSASLGNGAFEYATQGVVVAPEPGLGGGAGGTVQSLDFGTELVPTVTAGWDFGEEWGVLAVRWWSLDATATGEVDDGFNSQTVGELLIPPTFFDGRVDAAFADATVEITNIDVLFGQEFGHGKHGSGYWRAGLRSFSLDEQLQVDYHLQGAILDRATITTQVDGIGPVVGFGGRLEIGDRVRISGDAGAGYLIGETDYVGEWLISETTLFDVTFDLEQLGEELGLLQLEGSLGVAVRAWRHLEVELGYRFHAFQEVIRRADFVDDVAVNRVVFSDEDLTAHGPYLAVRWHGPFTDR